MLPAGFFYLTFLALLIILTLIWSFYEIKKNRLQLEKERKKMNQKVYETLVLREVGERIGYELNIGRILETIIGSLDKLVPYSAASYMLVSPDPNKITYRVHLSESVNQNFIDQMREHMLMDLNKTTQHVYFAETLLPSLSGVPVNEVDPRPISSLWIVPLRINNRGVGVLGIASHLPDQYQGAEMEILIQILSQANKAVTQLEGVIKTEQSKILSMISSMADGVIMLDTDYNMTSINSEAKKILKLNESYEITILDVTNSLSDKLDLRSKIDECIKNSAVFNLENLILDNHYYQLSISPAKDNNNKTIGVIVIIRDVNAEKELERVREDFMAMMVHELRAPLSVMAGTTDMFLRQPNIASEPEGKELLISMKNSTTSMLDLVNDLLDIAKIEAGKFQVLKANGDLGAIVKDRVTFFVQLAQSKQVALSSVEYPYPLLAEFDRERIIQVFNNLISNGIKFTAPGGRIIISAKPVNSALELTWRFPDQQNSHPDISTVKFPCIEVTISDTGVGIQPDQLSQLFSKFKQLSLGYVAQQKGTGLGLVIAKGIIESHGGSIFVESEFNVGTTFHFTLPITPHTQTIGGQMLSQS